MKKIINEESLFLKILENGFSRNNHPVFLELLVVAKHVRQRMGYGEKRIVREVAKFCEKRNPYFNFTLSEPTLIKVAKAAIKHPQYKKPNFPIYISSYELERIATVKNFAYQKMLIASLAVARHSGNEHTFSDTTKDIRFIIACSGEKFSVPRFVEFVTPIAKDIEIFEHVNNRSHYYRLIGNQGGEVTIIIESDNELENIGEIYRNYRGGTISWCKECGLEFIKLRNNMVKCGSCTSKKKDNTLKTLTI